MERVISSPGWATRAIGCLGSSSFFRCGGEAIVRDEFCGMKRENLLMVSDSDHNADMLYAVGMFVPDPFIYARVNGKPHIVMSDLEVDRSRHRAGGVRRHRRCALRARRYGRLLALRRDQRGRFAPGGG